MKSTSLTDSSVTTDSSNNVLPGDDEIWSKCALGRYDQWPPDLRNYVLTAASLAYPTAIFWEMELVIFHNQAWSNLCGSKCQGQPQEQLLSAETVEVFRSVMARGVSKEIQRHDLLRDESIAAKQPSTAVVSPLIPPHKDCRAVMVQLLPKPMFYSPVEMGAQGQHGTIVDRGGSGKPNDEVNSVETAPIDEHPFFRRFAEMLPAGLAILAHDAHAVFVNQHFYDLTTSLGDDRSFTSWPQSIHDEDYGRVMDAYREAFQSRRELRTEFRAKGEPHPWRLLLLTPLGDENLQHVSLREYGGFICCIVDISSEKSAELNERKAAQQARERKEQQERFIDMISHEIRNPLSAVLHCAEEISDVIRDRPTNEIDTRVITEAVETILLCVSHQKNIVDDVLSFSKLDASLLSLVPKPCKPSEQLSKTLKMFQHEFRKQTMDFALSVDGSYKEAKADGVMADMPRIGQVLINLITNAIKFTTRKAGERRIECSIAASISRPKSYPPDVVFFESEKVAQRMDATTEMEWGGGEALYIMVAAKDSGIGISPEGQQRLFERFRQATPKTEEVYGGSGLGLNISRKICHLHGGEIGVASREGEGSTFGFFFKVKRTDGSPVNDTNDSEQGDADLREHIQAAGAASPQDIKDAEPFDWKPSYGPRTASQEKTTMKADNHAHDKSSNEAATPGVAQEKSLGSTEQAELPSRSSTSGVGERTLKQSNCPMAAPKRAYPRPHVLLVEDNVINQRIVFRKLEAKGFHVTVANNGQEAVDAVKKVPKSSSGDEGAFDVILMDQEMPVMDGNTATRAIRALEKEGEVEHIPCLGVTANVRGAQQDEMFASGMEDVISKPYKIGELVDKIHALLSGSPM